MRLAAIFLPSNPSKEAHHGQTRPPPRRTDTSPELMTTLPLDQLWTRLPQAQRQELLGQLTRILTQRLEPHDSKEAAHE